MSPRFVEDSSEVPHHKNLPHLKCQEVLPHMQRSIVANSGPQYGSFAGKKERMQDEPDGRLLVGTKWGKKKCKNRSQSDDTPTRGHKKILFPL
jgi:hypothetical protein